MLTWCALLSGVAKVISCLVNVCKYCALKQNNSLSFATLGMRVQERRVRSLEKKDPTVPEKLLFYQGGRKDANC